MMTYFENNIKLVIHDKKIHGIFMYELERDNLLEWCDLLIVPDAGTNNYEEHKILKNKYKIDIIVLDHHKSDKGYSEDAIVVNNQLSDIAHNFTGATMAYKFLQSIDNVYGEDNANDFLDLVAIGMIGDMADTRDHEIQLLIRNGLSNICNPLIEELITKTSFQTGGKVNQTTFSFNIIPLINAATRVASHEQMILIAEAFCSIGLDRTFEYKPIRGKHKGETLIETLYENVSRLLVSIKGKQDRMVKKALEGSKRPLKKGIYNTLDLNYKNKKVLVVNATDFIENSGLSGLIANKIMYRYNIPTLVYMIKENGAIRGSGRGEQIDMFRTKLSNNDDIFFAEGHEPAFGFKLKFNKNDIKEKILDKKLNELELKKNNVSEDLLNKELSKFELNINEYFKNEDTNIQHVVDFSIHSSCIEDYMLEDLCQLEDYFGGGLKQPKIYIYDICIPSEIISTGKDENKFVFTHNDIEFILFKPSSEKIEELIDWSEELCYNIVGRPSINEFDGQRKVQIIIEDIERINNNNLESSNDDWGETEDDKSNDGEESKDTFEW